MFLRILILFFLFSCGNKKINKLDTEKKYSLIEISGVYCISCIDLFIEEDILKFAHSARVLLNIRQSNLQATLKKELILLQREERLENVKRISKANEYEVINFRKSNRIKHLRHKQNQRCSRYYIRA